MKKKSFYIPKPETVKKFTEDPLETKEYQKIFQEISAEEKLEDLSKKNIKLSTSKDSIQLEKIPKRTISRIIALQFNYLNSFDEKLTIEKFKKDIFFLWNFEIDKPLVNENIFNYAEKIIDVLIDKKENIIKEVSKNLKENWSWERISLVNQSILITIVSCFYLKDIKDSAILFNEAILITKWFSDKEDYKFINGILEKIYKGLD